METRTFRRTVRLRCQPFGLSMLKDFGLTKAEAELKNKTHECEEEAEEKSFEEWWDELDDIEKEEYNAYMSNENKDLDEL